MIIDAPLVVSLIALVVALVARRGRRPGRWIAFD